MLVVLLIPEDFMARVLLMAFGQEISNLKVIFLLLIGSEILRTLGMVCHNMLVSQALIFPQAVFETIAQSIILLAVFFLVAENFLLLYFSALFASMVFWMVSNFLYIVYLSKQNGS